MAQFLSCVGKIMNDPSGDGVIAKFSFFVAFLKEYKRPAMAPIEAPGSPLSNKLLLIEISALSFGKMVCDVLCKV